MPGWPITALGWIERADVWGMMSESLVLSGNTTQVLGVNWQLGDVGETMQFSTSLMSKSTDAEEEEEEDTLG